MLVRTTSIALLAVALLVACGGDTGLATDVDPDSPSGAVDQLARAVGSNDIDLYISLLPEQDRVRAESSRAMVPDKFDSVLEGSFDTLRRHLSGATVVDEQVRGSRATVTLESSAGARTEFQCVQESDGWKVAVSG